nr:hypothetical protein [uncultured Actinoplanes sp.]
MNETVRMIALTGAAVAAGLSFGVGPASAAPAAPAPMAAASVQVDHRGPEVRSKVVGYYRTPGECVKAGRIGEFRKKWDGFSCDKVRRGFHRNHFALTATWKRSMWHAPQNHGPVRAPHHRGPRR